MTPGAAMSQITRRTALAVIVGAAVSSMAVTASAAMTDREFEEEFFRLYHQLDPMRRLFIRAQLSIKAPEESVFDRHCTPAEVDEIYKKWLAGFPRFVITKFESGEWTV